MCCVLLNVDALGARWVPLVVRTQITLCDNSKLPANELLLFALLSAYQQVQSVPVDLCTPRFTVITVAPQNDVCFCLHVIHFKWTLYSGRATAALQHVRNIIVDDVWSSESGYTQKKSFLLLTLPHILLHTYSTTQPQQHNPGPRR